MSKIESKLEVALANLMLGLLPHERNELSAFVDQMHPDGKEWWLDWAKNALQRRKKQNELAYRLQQNCKDFPPNAFSHILNSFSEEGLDQWLQDIQEPAYPLARIQPTELPMPYEKLKPKEIFNNLFRELQWIHHKVSPALYGMSGTDQLKNTLQIVANESTPLDEIGILRGNLFTPEHGDYVYNQVAAAFPIDLTRVSTGIVLRDYYESFSCFLLHANQIDRRDVPVESALSLITSQSNDFSNMQQLRIQMYDLYKKPVATEDCYIIVGDITSVEDRRVSGPQTFVLKHHPEKPFFFRDIQ